METDSGFRTEEGSPKEESPSSKVRPLFFRTDNLSWLPFDRDSQIYYSLVRRGTRTKRSERPEIEWLPGRKARRSKDLRWFCKENEIKTFWRKVQSRLAWEKCFQGKFNTLPPRTRATSRSRRWSKTSPAVSPSLLGNEQCEQCEDQANHQVKDKYKIK